MTDVIQVTSNALFTGAAPPDLKPGFYVNVSLVVREHLVGTFVLMTDALGLFEPEQVDLAQKVVRALMPTFPQTRQWEDGQELPVRANVNLEGQLLDSASNSPTISMSTYVDRLTSRLWRMQGVRQGKISCKLDVQDVVLPIDVGITCGLIIYELVSNALKYAFPGEMRGGVYVGLYAHQEQVILVVRDDGIGLPTDLDMHNQGSLGLQLTLALVDQLEGTIKVSTTQGTRYQITFPETIPGRVGWADD